MSARSAVGVRARRRRAAERRGAAGHGLVGLLQALAGSCLLLGIAAAALLPSARGRSVDAAARALAARARTVAARAVAEGREAALVFPSSGSDEPLGEWVDLDGDGIARADVDGREDGLVDLFTLSREVPGTRIGRPPWPSIPDVPPGTGRLTPADPAVRFGAARMLVFDPDGHATPGTVFVTDGDGFLCAVVVSGAASRVRTWCYDRPGDAWRRR